MPWLEAPSLLRDGSEVLSEVEEESPHFLKLVMAKNFTDAL